MEIKIEITDEKVSISGSKETQTIEYTSPVRVPGNDAIVKFLLWELKDDVIFHSVLRRAQSEFGVDAVNDMLHGYGQDGYHI